MASRLIEDPKITDKEMAESQEAMRTGKLMGKRVELTYSILSDGPIIKRSWHSIFGTMTDDPANLRLVFTNDDKVEYIAYEQIYSQYKIKELVTIQ